MGPGGCGPCAGLHIAPPSMLHCSINATVVLDKPSVKRYFYFVHCSMDAGASRDTPGFRGGWWCRAATVTYRGWGEELDLGSSESLPSFQISIPVGIAHHDLCDVRFEQVIQRGGPAAFFKRHV